MPNIEIHGLSNLKSLELAKQIFADLQRHGRININEIVITICKTTVLDFNLHKQPFLRIIGVCRIQEEEIIEILARFDIDIEQIQAVDFYPKGYRPKAIQ